VYEKNDKIAIYVPNCFVPEITYIINILFGEFLGLDYLIKIESNMKDYEIHLPNGNKLVIENHFFSHFEDGLNYLNEAYIPKTVIFAKNNFILEGDIPVIYGSDRLEIGNSKIICGIDIFASSFFMLTRWEEHANKTRDNYDRFPAWASLALKYNFLERPIVNEYVEMLWKTMKYLCPGLGRKQHIYKVLLTHDVDNPFMVYDQGWYQLFRNIGSDLLKRRNLNLAIQRATCKIRNDPKFDPANTFDFIMDLSEKHGLRSEFYFITNHTAGSLDGSGYSIESPQIRSLMRRIYDRGHYIGLHASYNSFRNSQQTKKEFEKLVMVAEKLGIKQDSWGGRQHYLRWENPTTWQNWEDAGLDYDSTLTFADYAGFRTGTCYKYPVFNILTRKTLQLHEKPLIVMDGTLFGQNYMNLRIEDALRYVEHLSKCCRLFGGTFVLLWHNSYLIEQWQKHVYQEIIKIVS